MQHTERPSEMAAANGGAEMAAAELCESELDGLFCSICLEPWSSGGKHQICVPLCNHKCEMKDVRLLYTTQPHAVYEMLHKKVQSLEDKCGSLEKKCAAWAKKDADWQKEVCCIPSEDRVPVNVKEMLKHMFEKFFISMAGEIPPSMAPPSPEESSPTAVVLNPSSGAVDSAVPSLERFRSPTQALAASFALLNLGDVASPPSSSPGETVTEETSVPVPVVPRKSDSFVLQAQLFGSADTSFRSANLIAWVYSQEQDLVWFCWDLDSKDAEIRRLRGKCKCLLKVIKGMGQELNSYASSSRDWLLSEEGRQAIID